jgi:hypothetical protein
LRAHPLVLAAALVLSGCEDAPETETMPDRGDFRVVYEPVRDPGYAEWREELRRDGFLEAFAADLNRTLALPADVSLALAECGAADAYYDPEARRIRICLELLDSFSAIFEDEVDEAELDDAVAGATYFTLYHEVGHALIHVLDLPVTGREEDAADQLATFVLLDGTEEGEAAALDGAQSFLLEHEREGWTPEESPFWDEHSLDPQRFYNILCWVYGHDPAQYAYLVEEGFLPPERAERCGEEYIRLERSWSSLLSPYLKK